MAGWSGKSVWNAMIVAVVSLTPVVAAMSLLLVRFAAVDGGGHANSADCCTASQNWRQALCSNYFFLSCYALRCDVVHGSPDKSHFEEEFLLAVLMMDICGEKYVPILDTTLLAPFSGNC